MVWSQCVRTGRGASAGPRAAGGKPGGGDPRATAGRQDHAGAGNRPDLVGADDGLRPRGPSRPRPADRRVDDAPAAPRPRRHRRDPAAPGPLPRAPRARRSAAPARAVPAPRQRLTGPAAADLRVPGRAHRLRRAGGLRPGRRGRPLGTALAPWRLPPVVSWPGATTRARSGAATSSAPSSSGICPSSALVSPPGVVHRFWTMLAHYHGQIWNGAELARSFGIGETTVRRYLDLLAGTFMVRVLPPWSENLGKRVVRAPKVYVSDSGLLHTLLDLGTMRALERPSQGRRLVRGLRPDRDPARAGGAAGAVPLLGDASGRRAGPARGPRRPAPRVRVQAHRRSRRHQVDAHRLEGPATCLSGRGARRRGDLLPGRGDPRRGDRAAHGGSRRRSPAPPPAGAVTSRAGWGRKRWRRWPSRSPAAAGGGSLLGDLGGPEAQGRRDRQGTSKVVRTLRPLRVGLR